MDVLYYLLLGVKGFLITLGFALSAFIVISFFALIFSLANIGKEKKDG